MVSQGIKPNGFCCFQSTSWRKLPWRAALILLCHADFNMLLVWYTFVAIPNGTCWEFSKRVVGTRLVDGRVFWLLFCSLRWGGVGWGNNVHLHFLTYMMLRYCVGWGGMGWGNNVHLHFLTCGVITFICTSSHI